MVETDLEVFFFIFKPVFKELPTIVKTTRIVSLKVCTVLLTLVNMG